MPHRIQMRENSVFHIFNKSIAGFTIFNKVSDYEKFTAMITYHLMEKRPFSFSELSRRHKDVTPSELLNHPKFTLSDDLKLIAYCLMPTHFHLILHQKSHTAISSFMHGLQSSYSHFFNLKHNRKGPLWQGPFKHVLCESDEQLLHLTRYVHLNPVTAGLSEKPEDWKASSYHEYLSISTGDICCIAPLMQVAPKQYADFVNNRIEDQRALAKIKKLLLD